MKKCTGCTVTHTKRKKDHFYSNPSDLHSPPSPSVIISDARVSRWLRVVQLSDRSFALTIYCGNTWQSGLRNVNREVDAVISETENLSACSVVEAGPFPLPPQALSACSCRCVKGSILGLQLSGTGQNKNRQHRPVNACF